MVRCLLGAYFGILERVSSATTLEKNNPRGEAVVPETGKSSEQERLRVLWFLGNMTRCIYCPIHFTMYKN